MSAAQLDEELSRNSALKATLAKLKQPAGAEEVTETETQKKARVDDTLSVT